MLVITRKKDESILIGNDILVTVLKVQWGKEGATVRLGLTVPDKSVPIIRTELLRGTAVEEMITYQLPGALTC